MSRSDVRLLTPQQAAEYRADWHAYLQSFLERHDAAAQSRRSALERLLTYLRG